jgi:hypothetical protein
MRILVIVIGLGVSSFSALAQTPSQTVANCVIQARKETPPAYLGYPFDAYLDSDGLIQTSPSTNGNMFTGFLFRKCVTLSGQFVPREDKNVPNPPTTK